VSDCLHRFRRDSKGGTCIRCGWHRGFPVPAGGGEADVEREAREWLGERPRSYTSAFMRHEEGPRHVCGLLSLLAVVKQERDRYRVVWAEDGAAAANSEAYAYSRLSAVESALRPFAEFPYELLTEAQTFPSGIGVVGGGWVDVQDFERARRMLAL
jgi:hypothetical protein